MKKHSPILCLLIVFGLFNNVFGQATVTGNSLSDSLNNQKNIANNTRELRGKNQSNSSIANLHLSRGVSEAALNQYEKAIADYTVSISLSPQIKEAYVYRARAYEAMQNDLPALDDYKTLLSYLKNDFARSAVIFNNIANIQKRLKRYGDAIESCSQAILFDPNLGAAYANRAELYALTGQFQLAINDFTIAMGGYQDDKRLLSVLFLERADAMAMLKQYTNGINDYTYSIGLYPYNKIAYWNRAACYNLNGDYQLASDDYSTAISRFTGDALNLSRLHNLRAQTEMRLHQYKKAIRDDSLAISLDNNFPAAYWSRADAYAQTGDYQLSIADYTKAISFYQDNKRALSILYNNIANEEYFLEEYQKTITAAASAISFDPASWGPYLNRGRAYQKIMKNDLALNDFNKVLALDTTKRSSEYAFALFYTGNSDKAVSVIQNNLLATTDSYLIMNDYYNLACLYSLMNKPDEANIYLKKCIDAGYPKKYAQADAYLDNIRNTREFRYAVGYKIPD
ncbi:MAG: TPR end-of-group domain-containing protein [Mucilaginibacter sp.]